MSIFSKSYKYKYHYTGEAKDFIQQLPKFKQDAFEKWVDNLVLLIGSNNVLQYIEEKRRWNNVCKLTNNKVKCDFSQQAKNVMSQLDKFDEEECKIWYSNALVMTKGDIQNYLDALKQEQLKKR